jgi:autotransporter-associated beta strand protein
VTTDSFNPQIEAGRTSPAAGPVAFNFGTLTVNNTSGLAFVRFDVDTVTGTFDPASPNDAASVSFGATRINGNTTFDVNRPGTRTTVLTLGGVTDGDGTFGLTKADAGELVINAPSDYGGGTFVNGGMLRVTGAGTLGTGPAAVNTGVLRVESAAGLRPVTVNGGTFEAAATQTVEALTVNDGGRAVVTRSAGATGPTVLTTSALTIGTTTGQLDLIDNAVIVDYDAAGGSPLANIRAAVASGYNAGAWDGPGIVTSAGRTNPSLGVGYAIPPGGGTFLGQPHDDGSVLLRTTLRGDANLNGTVAFEDLVALAQNYNTTDGSAVWGRGDFNYDGNVNFTDLVALAQNYNSSMPSAAQLAGLGGASFAQDAAAAFARVPEPGVMSVLAVGGAALTRRRRNRH